MLDRDDEYEVSSITGTRSRRDGPDYVELKIRGLKDEIKKLKQLQVTEQKNINEMQSIINGINSDVSMNEFKEFEHRLSRREKKIVHQAIDFPMVNIAQTR